MKKKETPKWAINAANRFVIPVAESENGDPIIDVERLLTGLVALQLKAEKRGYKRAINILEQPEIREYHAADLLKEQERKR